MKTHPHDLTLTPLARRAVLTLPGGTGRAVGVFSGSVWITQQDDLEDHVLGPGESLQLRRPGLAVVEALQDAQLILFETAPAERASRPGRADAPPDIAAYERQAHQLRRQAIAQAVAQVGRAVAAAFAAVAAFVAAGTPGSVRRAPTPR